MSVVDKAASPTGTIYSRVKAPLSSLSSRCGGHREVKVTYVGHRTPAVLARKDPWTPTSC